jgi:DNA-binding NarL/FixJ family response regulator
MKLMVVSDLDDATVSRSALEAGANGFVLKRAIATDMLAAVDAVLAGQLYVSPKAAKLPTGSQSNQGECI